MRRRLERVVGAKGTEGNGKASRPCGGREGRGDAVGGSACVRDRDQDREVR